MKPTALLVALGAFAAGAGLVLAGAEGHSRPARASIFRDGTYGYSIMPPAFPKGEKNSTLMTASFYAPSRNGFSANLGVMIQNVTMTADQYRDLSATQFKEKGFTVLSEVRKKVGGKDAILWEYEGTMKGREYKWVALAVIDTDRVLLATGTAPKADFDLVGDQFRASLETFKPEE